MRKYILKKVLFDEALSQVTAKSFNSFNTHVLTAFQNEGKI